MAIICVNRSESELVLSILIEMLKRFEMSNENVTKQMKRVINHTLALLQHAFYSSVYCLILGEWEDIKR
ncbi:hypothetical protein CD148_07005 [Staphylococcus delphini]|uniref:Uncharacterized protein n=1 Tax=Staphylococcus delphini TaxID=53344 RepID=A0AAX0QTT9_9STAP|nr:hypothetical protein B5C07_08505 [Staphylococcus delphini]PNZ94452.1 hypothetical protein CD148_07005 [Staphylococcus delphini]RIZ52073.1 hypothetical protein CDL68_09315 [Staphylococcus delphini]